MKKNTFTESQIVTAIKKQENGMSVNEVVRQDTHQGGAATWATNFSSYSSTHKNY